MEIEPLIKCSTFLSDSFSSSGVRVITGKFNRDTDNNKDYDDYDDKRNSFHDKQRAEDDNNFTIIVTGAGVINAAHGLTVYLERCIKNNKNLIIIQTGIAGVFEGSGLKIGDVAVASSDTYIHTGVGFNKAGVSSIDSVKYSDLKIASEKNLSYCYPLNPLPFELVHNCPESKSGKFIFDKELIKRACSNIKESLVKEATSRRKDITSRIEDKTCNAAIGDFITVSTITAAPEHVDHLFKAFNRPCMESMEGAASAHIAKLYNIGFIQVRAGSNLVGERDKDKWNVPLACERACFAVKSIIENGALFVESLNPNQSC
ncbi:MAG: hypothetical protein AB7U45_11975 [Desulfamplus sp.]